MKHVVHGTPKRDWYSLLVGLMFQKPRVMIFAFDKPTWLFEKDPRVSVQCWFVFYPLDILYLDANKKVVEKVNLKPFRSYTPTNRARYVVEIPGKSNINVGDSVSFK